MSRKSIGRVDIERHATGDMPVAPVGGQRATGETPVAPVSVTRWGPVGQWGKQKTHFIRKG